MGENPDRRRALSRAAASARSVEVYAARTCRQRSGQRCPYSDWPVQPWPSRTRVLSPFWLADVAMDPLAIARRQPTAAIPEALRRRVSTRIVPKRPKFQKKTENFRDSCLVSLTSGFMIGASGRIGLDSTASTGSCPACGSFFLAPCFWAAGRAVGLLPGRSSRPPRYQGYRVAVRSAVRGRACQWPGRPVPGAARVRRAGSPTNASRRCPSAPAARLRRAWQPRFHSRCASCCAQRVPPPSGRRIGITPIFTPLYRSYSTGTDGASDTTHTGNT
jgi:hypothetical protein